MAITDYYPGAALKLISSGAIVAAAKGFRVDLDIQLEPVEEFGDILVVEHVPNAVTVRGSIDLTLVKNQSVFAQNLTTRNKSALLSFDALPMYLEDTRTGEAVMSVIQLRIASASFSFAKGTLAMQSCTWVARDVTDEVKLDG